MRMAAAGWDVYAGVRNPADAAALTAEGNERVKPVEIEVTNRADIASLDSRLPQSLDAVVNNAGIGVGGPIEAIPIDELRHQFEVNVIGQVAVTQAVMSRLRESRGRVVFVSSISGLVSSPMLGAYCASKFALEAIADAMRVEVRPWRISVSLIEPGQIDTDLWRNAEATLDETVAGLAPHHRDLYAKHIQGMRKAIPTAQKMAVSPERVASSIERALTSRRPRARYVSGGAGARAQAWSGRLPTAIIDAAQRSMTGVPKRA